MGRKEWRQEESKKKNDFGSFCVLVVDSNRMGTAFAQMDPGVRGGKAGAGEFIPGLTAREQDFFGFGLIEFSQEEGVEDGFGPRFNMDSCAGCHAQPATGGTNPSTNPQVEVAKKAGAKDVVPFFITLHGPVREARFKFKANGQRDGGVQNLFTITGRVDAQDCIIAQPDFRAAAKNNNLIFHIPTPVFGAGLIENISEDAIIENKNSKADLKSKVGIIGKENRSGNDGTITRFGWKAQNKSLLMFSGEAYNVEQGVTNELFQQERDETPGCVLNFLPEDRTDLIAVEPSNIELFAFFKRRWCL
jgi:hypothetical protein